MKTSKTAGTSIEAYLSQHCGSDDVLTPFGKSEAGHRPRNYRGLFNPVFDWKLGERPGRVLSRFVRLIKYHPHMPAAQVRHRLPREIWDSYFKFCVERNPWDKVVSDYHFRKKRHGEGFTLRQYMDLGRFPSDLGRYTEPGEPLTIIVDEVLRYESLDAELSRVFARLGVPFEGQLTASAKGGYRTQRRPYIEEYDEYTLDAVSNAFRNEIKLFGYRPQA